MFYIFQTYLNYFEICFQFDMNNIFFLISSKKV